eukprot:g18495.t1
MEILYCIVLYCIVLYCIISYRIVSYRIVSYHIVSYRIVSYRIVSSRLVSSRIVSYRIVLKGGPKIHFCPKAAATHFFGAPFRFFAPKKFGTTTAKFGKNGVTNNRRGLVGAVQDKRAQDPQLPLARGRLAHCTQQQCQQQVHFHRVARESCAPQLRGADDGVRFRGDGVQGLQAAHKRRFRTPAPGRAAQQASGRLMRLPCEQVVIPRLEIQQLETAETAATRCCFRLVEPGLKNCGRSGEKTALTAALPTRAADCVYLPPPPRANTPSRRLLDSCFKNPRLSSDASLFPLESSPDQSHVTYVPFLVRACLTSFHAA